MSKKIEMSLVANRKVRGWWNRKLRRMDPTNCPKDWVTRAHRRNCEGNSSFLKVVY